jgi:4'-phosphopantetheinyl transferase
MAEVHWLEQAIEDVPARDDWLSASEALCLEGMHVAKRRVDWRLGRWTAKRAVAACLNLASHAPALADIEIRPAPSGAPEVFLSRQPAKVAISISHSAGVAVCAVAPPSVALGCDLETTEPRSDAFVADYFTVEEQVLVARSSAGDRPRLLALLWSGKESALKALREGLRLDTRYVSVCPMPSRPGQLGDWHPLKVHLANGQVLHGWWRHAGAQVRTLVSDPATAQPILLWVPPERGGCRPDVQRV